MTGKYWVFLFLVGLLSAFSWNCQQTFTLGPTSAPALTATFTHTSTPCGYPGNTCTFTSTPTATATSTATPTGTSTYTPTNTGTPTNSFTPTPTLTPPALLGWPLSPNNHMQVFWQTTSDPHVTSYKVYRGPSSGAMTYWGSVANTGGWIAPSDNSTTVYNEYVCVTASGSLPDSARSNVVHAVSGTTALNSLALSATASASPTLSIVGGSVAGAVQRCWLVAPNGGAYIDWVWGEQAAALTSVAYGFSGYGISYVPALALASATSTNFITATFNSEYWCVDYSYYNFTTP